MEDKVFLKIKELYENGTLTEDEYNTIVENRKVCKQSSDIEEMKKERNLKAREYYNKNKEKIRAKNLARYYLKKSKHIDEE